MSTFLIAARMACSDTLIRASTWNGLEKNVSKI